MSEINADSESFAKACERAIPMPGQASLLDSVNQETFGLEFHLSMTSAGWYRLGRLIDLNGNRIADNVEDWVEEESEGDVLTLIEKHGDKDLFVTKIKGRTHYLTARTGPRTLDFAQIEVEETFEEADRPLFHPDWIPNNVEDVIDPFDFPDVTPRPISLPKYQFKRITYVADRFDELESNHHLDDRFRRFVHDWDRSSAGDNTRFSDQWVLTMAPYLDASGEHRDEIRPISTFSRKLPSIGKDEVRSGPALARMLHDFDVEVGYPMAWYFFMLTRDEISERLGEAVVNDHVGGEYSYLPQADVKVLGKWRESPYQLYHALRSA